jgi:AAA15 family ATPase/GTPase
MLLVKKISFENFRSFRDKTELDLQNVNIFVGPNKAGKSNIIMCFQFLNSISRNDWNDLYIDNVFDYDKNMRITIQIVFYLNIEERRDLVRRFFQTFHMLISK